MAVRSKGARRRFPALAGLGLALALAAMAPAALAQDLLPIRVGQIKSQKSCTLYQQSAGRSAVVATRDAVGAASSWRTWLVKDCVDNFASIRTSLEAALASSGKFAVGAGPGAYVVTGVVSDVGGSGALAGEEPSSGLGDYSVASRKMFVNIDLKVADSSGRVVYGVLLTKAVETGSNVQVGGFQAAGGRSGEALYGELQHEVALAAARLVAFRLAPLTVIGGDGRQIRLNYGAPLLKLGTMLMATSPDGATTVRYNVISAGDGLATAEVDGEGDAARIRGGSTAVVIEPEDPAANGRRLKRVELP